MVKNSGIYKIQNILDKKIYVGSAVNLKKRKKDHFCELNLNRHCNTYLQRAYNKYGKDNFVFEVIEYVEDKKDLINREQYYIDTLNVCNRNIGYNICEIAGSRLGCKLSKKNRIKLSIMRKGHKPWNKGIPMSQEAKDKARETRKNIKLPDDFGERVSKATRGKPKSEEHKIKISQCQKGKKLSEEHKLKISKNSSVKRKIINIDTNIIFNSIADAAKLYSLDCSAISKVCKMKLNKCGGYRWQYYDT